MKKVAYLSSTLFDLSIGPLILVFLAGTVYAIYLALGTVAGLVVATVLLIRRARRKSLARQAEKQDDRRQP